MRCTASTGRHVLSRPARTQRPRVHCACMSLGSLQPHIHNIWTRPRPEDESFTKPSYIPRPAPEPYMPPAREDDRPIYTPAPEFKPADRPAEQPKAPKEMPKMPEYPDAIPAGPSKTPEKPTEKPDKREAPPSPQPSQ